MPIEVTFTRSDGTVVPLVPEPFCMYCCKPIPDEYATHGVCHDCNKNDLRVLPKSPTVYDLEDSTGKKFSFTLMQDARPFYFMRAGAVGLYLSAKRSLLFREIWRMKRGPKSEAVSVLLAECLDHVLHLRFNEFLNCSALVPIPSGSGTRPQPTYRLAYDLAKLNNDYEVVDALRFAKGYTSQRDTPDRESRWSNPRDKISVKSTTETEGLKGEAVLLLDDTFVRGGTGDESARVLLRHGAKEVYLLVVGRDVWPGDLEFVGYTGRV